jgi:hypothetical protein
VIRLDRSRRGPDVWLGEKMIFFAVGAALGIAGMVTGRDWITYLAIAVLALGLGLRLLGRGGRQEEEEEEEERAGSGER